ncbi:2,3-bisphosphoglycerate-independent phosphoglycerate mutase, partial [Patescibacteria group bacterium]|nr:2,3-bisphosphoglycerate-independent phosphoglycerate mutase [Patescibacteria group bacterium]
MGNEIEWKKVNPVVLLVLDGFGVSLESKGNAIINASTPIFDKLWNDYPHVLLKASGESVGLPWGEYGNSEVGHITLGLGAIIKQSLTMIRESIVNGEFYKNKKIIESIQIAKKKRKKVHVAGVFSPAGVHGHTDYMLALLDVCKAQEFSKVFFHLFTDGRDVPPQSFNEFWQELEDKIKQVGFGRVASVAGRFYAMDRISRWDRTDLAYKAMLGVEAQTASSVGELIENYYSKGIYDEKILPTYIVDSMGKPVGSVEEGDTIIFINHRRDRIRQMASFFASDEKVVAEARGGEKLADTTILSMVFYELVNMGVKVAFS